MSIDTTADTRTLKELVEATGLNENADIRDVLLDLTTRPLNCLLRESIYTLGDLANRTDDDLLDIRNFGVGSLDNVRAVLAQLAARYAHIMQSAPPWLKEIADLAGVLCNGYDEHRINRVFARLSETAPGFLLCVWAEHDASSWGGFGGDSEIYLDADQGGGLCEVGGGLWAWLSQNPIAPGMPTTPGDPATWKGNRAGFNLDDLPVDDGRHNFARTDS
ncbi:DNA-directed RNA polymerase subunit alpha C-terminal domain-containing protein [Nonomuraea angiospora]|uniref:DNA-directed RNA polymerase subunit alpha C-terminal domain-containing protein n=1 Tax=Nonomuraea angiospora TaxID=46172 RepID=UPI00344BEBE3